MSRSRRSNNQVSLFPFLAVLVCAMGALIFLLIVTTRQIREDALARVQQPALEDTNRKKPESAEPPRTESESGHADELLAAIHPPQPEIIPAEPPPAIPPVQRLADIPLNPLFAPEPVPADPDAPLRTILTSLTAERDRTRQQVVQTSRTLEQERARISELRREHQRLTAQLEAQLQQHTRSNQKAAELEAARSEIAGQIAKARRELEERRHNRKLVPSRFAFVPFDGRTGTTLRPILIECTGQGLRFQPEDVLLTEDDLKGFSFTLNPLLTGTQTLVDFWSDPQNAATAEERGRKPYVLLIVRPSGTTAFYAARALLQELDRPFGYELVEEDWEFAPPPLNRQAQQRLRTTVDELLAQRQQVMDAALAGQESGRLSVGGRRMRFTPGGGFEEVDENGEPLLGRGGERLGTRRVPGSQATGGSGTSSTTSPQIAGRTPPLSRPISAGQRGSTNSPGQNGQSPGVRADSPAPLTRWSQTPDVPQERRLPVIAGRTPFDQSTSPGGRGQSGPGTGTGPGQSSTFTGDGGTAKNGGTDQQSSSLAQGAPFGEAAGSGGAMAGDDPRSLITETTTDGSGWRGADRSGSAGREPFADRGTTSSVDGSRSQSADHGTGTQWSSNTAAPGTGGQSGEIGNHFPERPGTGQGTLNHQTRTQSRAAGEFGPDQATIGERPRGGMSGSESAATAQEPFADRQSSASPQLLPQWQQARGAGTATSDHPASSPSAASSSLSSPSLSASTASSRSPQSSGQTSGGAGGSSSQFPSESGGTSAGVSASLFRGTPRSRRWGSSDRRAGIGFEREVVIGLRPDRITVKDGPAIPVGHGESPEELLVHVLEALEQEARTWGPPPQGFYWIPSIRFLVSPGGNQHYARLRGPLARWGVNSRAEQALETDTPTFTPEKADESSQSRK